MSNPYKHRFPVDQLENLYGRDDEIKDILLGIIKTQSPESHQLVGLVGSGKTSLLNVFEQLGINPSAAELRLLQTTGIDLNELSRLMFVKVSCQGISGSDTSAFWALLSDQLFRTYGTKFPDASEFPNSDSRTLYDVQDQLEWMVAKKLVLVIMFDDFDLLDDKILVDVSNNLRFLLENCPGSLVYITATHRPLLNIYNDLRKTYPREKFSTLLTYFTQQPIFLGAFSETGEYNFSRYIYDLSAAHGQPFTEEDEAFIRRSAGGYPSLTRFVCSKLFETYQAIGGEAPDYSALSKQLKSEARQILMTINSMLSPESLTKMEELLNRPIEMGEVSMADIAKFTSLGLIQIREGSTLPFSDLWSVQQMPDPISVEKVENGLSLDNDARTVTVEGKTTRLSQNEWKLLTYLIENRSRTCTRDELSELLLVGEEVEGKGSLDVTVSRLRKKIEPNPSAPRYIITVRGRGYRFDQLLKTEEVQIGQG